MRWARCSTRCARRRTSLLTSWPLLAFAVLFVIGVLLLAISSAMMRSLREETPQPQAVSWPQLVDESLAHTDAALRLDMVERLRIVDTDWSTGVLQQARREEPDPQVLAAIDLALQ